ncbi:hypothetical protein DWG18_02860 [Lysobacter sp. TY2-98]|uniref:hypothetical protein n=1 Tax=Lysobacter sp. TY2-98 TaxID=2290922 RepID=UPI000E2088AF|nr:hypothetical protein [Lysobacter sp. TY2-98]AXK71332.1 hypothetical protein DWG18_02860 [Lysobacter sp. TY2-98]
MQPSDWSQAFASLPTEAPPSDAWSRIAASLPGATPRHRRSTTGWAIAATLAVATGGAWLVMSASREAPTVIAQQDSAGPADARSLRADAAPGAAQSTTTNSSNKSGDATGASTAASMPAIAVAGHAPATLAAPAVASTTPHRASEVRPSAITGTAATPAPDAATTSASLNDLRAESARLEALVAYARDERMQSAAAAMLTGDVDDRLHVIDAALSQTALTDSERLDLWSRRVNALRELAGLEGTQRWLAAHGESYEDALARVD